MESTVITQVRALLKAQPFKPFRLQMNDGEMYWIAHPEWVFVPPYERTQMVYVAFPDGRLNHLNAQNITSLQTHEGDPAAYEEVA